VKATYVVGDVFECLEKVPDGSVDLLMTSPPFLALRSYLPADHPMKDKEIGQEGSPAAFLDVMLRLTAEWRRVLAPHGSICVELGDTYAGSGGGGGDYLPGGMREGQPGFGGSASLEAQRAGNAAHWRAKNRPRTAEESRLGVDARNRGNTSRGTGALRPGQQQYSGSAVKRDKDGITDGGRPPRTGRSLDAWPIAKSLSLIPESYRWALVYGINPFTGEDSPAGQWLARNVIRWCKPNPPVGYLADKFRPGTSDLVIACATGKRFFDLDAVRHEHQNGVDPAKMGGNGYGYRNPQEKGKGTVSMPGNANGAPPLDWWVIVPGGFKGSHYAVFPKALCVKPIASMVPKKVCKTCGVPMTRIVEKTEEYQAFRDSKSNMKDHPDSVKARHLPEKGGVGSLDMSEDPRKVGELYVTVGWTDCGHDNWRPGLVLDPFAGSGTALEVGVGHGIDALGFDIDERNAVHAEIRIGGLLLETTTVEEWKFQ
jgi:hypothetical protein